MLQFDRRFTSNGSRFIRGSHSKPPTDFVSRNKRAIREKARSQREAASATASTALPEQRLKGRPRSRNTFEKQQGERKKYREEERETARNVGNAATNADTVVISKSYLNELLRMSIVVRDEIEPRGKNVVKENQTLLKSEGKRVDYGGHVTVDPSAIPGLGRMSTQQQANHQGLTPQVSQHNERQFNNQGLSPHEKWLQDLAAQVEEQKIKKERDRLREQESTAEEYFPFGRPGGGAPIRSQSGTLLTDYRSRTRVQEQGGVVASKKADNMPTHQDMGYVRGVHESSGSVSGHPARVAASTSHHTSGVGNTGVRGGAGGDVMMMSPTRGDRKELYNTTPRFARGAGPHIDQYMRKEMDEKRRKRMEHMEFVRQQVIEKERAKLEEKLRKEREDALEESKLARERERMKEDFEREKERARMKELEARQRQALLQQRILEAEESARLAKLEARGVIVNAAHHPPTASFDEHTTTAVSTSMTSDLLCSHEGVYSSLSHSNLRSPSMLQLVNTTNETGNHGDDRSPPTQKGVATGARKGRAIGRSRVGDGERNRKNSKIPIMQQSPTTKTNSKGVVDSKVQSKVDGSTRSKKVLTKRPRDGGIRRGKIAAATTKSRAERSTVERSFSPPVPALAKRLKQSLPKKAKDTAQQMQRNACVVPGDETTCGDVNFFQRSSSPPVPALAKKLRNGGKFEGEDSSLAKRMRDPEDLEPRITQPSYERTSSPPVPALAKKLKANEGVGTADNVKKTLTKDEKSETSYSDGLLPPPSQAATTAGQNFKSKMLNSELRLDFSPRLFKDDSGISINRPPSCKPDSKPLTPVAMTTTTLPAIPIAIDDHYHSNGAGMVHPSASNRQRLILQQLTMLREGILSQQNSIDHRVSNILTNNKMCNF